MAMAMSSSATLHQCMLSSLPNPTHYSSKPMPLQFRLPSPRCTSSKEEQCVVPKKGAGRREMLAGLVVMPVGLVAVGTSMAASGPGINGGERVSQKADEILQSADKLNIEEAPQRYGPGSATSPNQDPAKLSQQSGSGLLRDLQGGVSDAGKQARESVEETLNKTQDLFGNSKSGGDIQGAAKEAVGQVQSFNDNATEQGQEQGKGIFGSIKESIQGLKSGIAQKNEDAKSAADEAGKKLQNKMMMK